MSLDFHVNDDFFSILILESAINYFHNCEIKFIHQTTSNCFNNALFLNTTAWIEEDAALQTNQSRAQDITGHKCLLYGAM